MTDKILRLFAGAILAAAISVPAIAETTKSKEMSVSFADLQLGTKAGIALAYQRISQAATRVCGPTPYSRSLREIRDFQNCRSEAIDGAVKSFNNPSLSAHASQVGKNPISTDLPATSLRVKTDADGTRHTYFSLEGYNVNSDAGAKRAMARLETATREVCGSTPTTRRLNDIRNYEACLGETFEKSVSASGNKSIITAHARAGGLGVTGATR